MRVRARGLSCVQRALRNDNARTLAGVNLHRRADVIRQPASLGGVSCRVSLYPEWSRGTVGTAVITVRVCTFQPWTHRGRRQRGRLIICELAAAVRARPFETWRLCAVRGDASPSGHQSGGSL
jgi:hypothetical protein